MAEAQSFRAAGSDRTVGAQVGWLIGAAFFALAAYFVLSSRLAPIPLAPLHLVDRADISTAPRRRTLQDPARTTINGVEQNCNACHRIFKSTSKPWAQLTMHTEIRLNHGLNNRCVNCHDEHDRQLLTLRDGATVAFAETPQLCSQCHGTVFRDWQAGTHGKTMGSWKGDSDRRVRLTCSQCHDPHSPRYEPYRPLPGPNTLRMGDQEEPSQTAEPGHKTSPLQQWLHKPALGSDSMKELSK